MGASELAASRFPVLLRLLDLIDFYLEFEINDHTGEPLNRDSVIQRHCDRLSSLQVSLSSFSRSD